MESHQYNLHTYALLKTPAEPLDLPSGIAGEVEIFSSDRLSAIVEPEVSVASFEDDSDRLMQAVLAHDRVICQVFRQTSVLPLRFGTYFASTATLQTYLKSHSQQYLEKLEQLDGKGEYSLKFIPLLPPEEPLASETGGRQYFLAKKQRYQQIQNFNDAQAAEWQKACVIATENYQSAIVEPTADREGQIYLLANRQDESLLLERYQSLQETCPHWELKLGEALPPYHFL
ncbi:GvpL/GvpF family gas vesicle protein [Kamptonema sp. UHCC 0994]|uniref:GvpL/GvpF family gas vesicle protein n=1 Tax=Kamptonema sp. UHCC 0994 TaxID=3031329 RepID=UPI0023BAAFF2|nr:GvpL/GvpF family gas vesicle protein [Kamptonema sp. UHCC 0994]MDF0556250.1 GvpL/GvpF family gas vesicle protein [Kamptonema sp. UHCC 0994]